MVSEIVFIFAAAFPDSGFAFLFLLYNIHENKEIRFFNDSSCGSPVQTSTRGGLAAHEGFPRNLPKGEALTGAIGCSLTY